MMKSRKERKLEAKQNNEVFVPQYNGIGVLSFEDYYGTGNERFNNKFVQFLKPSETSNELLEGLQVEEKVEEIVPEDVVDNDQVKTVEIELSDEQGKIEGNVVEFVEAELVEEKPKSKKGKFKQKLKKLFNK